ncbi:MAG: hypothetical protein WAW96_17350 [Alphaproteobacteria bacterium]
MRVGHLALVLSLVLASSLPAAAATITDVVTFDATNLFRIVGTGTPAGEVTGSFSITLDPALNYLNSTSGITLNSLQLDGVDFAIDSPVSFDYNSHNHTLVIGGLVGGALFPLGNDFALGVGDFTSDPKFLALAYSNLIPNNKSFNTRSFGGSYGVFLSVNGSISAVPLPASLPLFASALGLLVYLGWRMKRLSRPA